MTRTPAGRPTARDIVGVPILPPAPVTAAGVGLRSLLMRLADLMAPPPVLELEALFGVLEHRVLVVLCDAGVPDALTRPLSPSELAARVGADPIRLERLLRFAAARGWVRLDKRGRVRPNRFTRFLRRDHPGGWRAWVDFAGGPEVLAAVAGLSVHSDAEDAFATANGAPFFDWMAAHPSRWAEFDRAMAAGGRMHALGLAAALDWSTTATICDVGGGTGDLLAALLELLPGVRGTVFDLGDVVARCIPHEQLTAVAGDAFVAVPPGFDTYLLVNVLHDWSDDAAARILGVVAEAAAGSRVIVVDADRPPRPRDLLATGADVLMAALTDGGRERDRDAFAELGNRAGLRLVASRRLASGDRAHEYRRSAIVGP